MQVQQLIQAAQQARLKASAIYSHFRVGAALLTKPVRIYTGCNIESSAYGLTICAERVALFKALSEGETAFDKMAIVTDSAQFCPPCGACRQVLWDYAPNLTIILANAASEYTQIQLRDLLPQAFDASFFSR